jgi:hypothetical protein
MVTSSTIQNLNEFYVGDTSYSYVELEQDLCPWTVYVYPSQTMEDSFRTHNPAIFTTVVVAIFAFASAVFVFYDYVVERRQRVVARAAAQSSAVRYCCQGGVGASVLARLPRQSRENRVVVSSNSILTFSLPFAFRTLNRLQIVSSVRIDAQN